MILRRSISPEISTWKLRVIAVPPEVNPGLVCFRTRQRALRLSHVLRKKHEGFGADEKRRASSEDMAVLCGVGYGVQGFRCFPWLALNYYMAHGLRLSPATLQLLQSSANLPMAAKPVYGVFSDAFSIAGARRIPYIAIGVVLQILSWGSLALTHVAAQSLLTLTAFIVLGNLGASITEVAKDALVAEYSLKHGATGLQSYALMATSVGGILGNLLAGYFLTKAPPRVMFLCFALLLSLQLVLALRTAEEPPGFPALSFRQQFSELRRAMEDESIARPLAWAVASVAVVPSISGTVFCYQTQCLNLNPSVIATSCVVSQLALLAAALFYHRRWRKVPLRNLAGTAQVLYASAVLLDLALLTRVDAAAAFALCLSEAVSQFKLLPFSILLAGSCPPGCEASLTSFLASALCLSSIVRGALGVGLSRWLRISSGDYSALPAAVLVQAFAAVAPLLFLRNLPDSPTDFREGSRRWLEERPWRRAAIGPEFFYRSGKESES